MVKTHTNALNRSVIPHLVKAQRLVVWFFGLGVGGLVLVCVVCFPLVFFDAGGELLRWGG